MSTLFARALELRIGELEISNLNTDQAITDLLGVSFNISRSTSRETNKASITILNLSKDSRSKLAVSGKIETSLRAGYFDSRASLLFQGNVRFSNITNDGVNWVTRFDTGDGAEGYKTARINKSLKRAKPADLLRECGRVLEAVGIGSGNLQAKINEGGVVSGLNDFLGGAVLSGKAVDVMSQVVTSLGYEWSIQDEQIQILRPDETIGPTGVEIPKVTPASGLIGSPQVGKKGIVKFRSLLDGRLRPGGPVRLDSANIDGELRVENITHLGDTWGTDWYSDAEAKETKKAA